MVFYVCITVTFQLYIVLFQTYLAAAQLSINDDSNSNCRFPDSYQGTYKIQDHNRPPLVVDNSIREPIQYRQVFVGPTAIPEWGDCFEKNGYSYIFVEKRVGGFTCFRCFTIIQRAPNILQALIDDETHCSASVDQARTSCINHNTVSAGSGLILWSTDYECLFLLGGVCYSSQSCLESEEVQPQPCPLAGRAKLSYALNGREMCRYPSPKPSHISNCRRADLLDIRFRSCSFPDYEMSLSCLGTWDSGRGNGEVYFAVYNLDVDEYRCGIFNDARAKNGFAVAAFSNDSSCESLLQNSSVGYESFAIFQDEKPEWPALEMRCQFPSWLQGDWHELQVDPQMISYHYSTSADPADSPMTVYAKCVGVQNENDGKGERIRVFSRNHCGDPVGYHCLWIRRQSESVLEFKSGDVVLKNDDKSLCLHDSTFQNSSWTVLAANKPTSFVPCPHLGHFSTEFPRLPSNQHQLCYNWTSDCKQPHLVKYVAYLCGSSTIFDVRQYACLASWAEGGVQFTYAIKTDDTRKECFLSVADGQLHMLSSGEQCKRNYTRSSLMSAGLLADGQQPSTLFMQQMSCEEMLRPELTTVSPRDRTKIPKKTDLSSLSSRVHISRLPTAFDALAQLLLWRFLCQI